MYHLLTCEQSGPVQENHHKLLYQKMSVIQVTVKVGIIVSICKHELSKILETLVTVNIIYPSLTPSPCLCSPQCENS